jgi:adenylate kinase family enzyme
VEVLSEDCECSLVKKINVIGTSGTGKSTFSKRLAQILNFPYIEMDKIFWGPDWYWPSDDEFFEKLTSELQQESWVLDGNYTRTVPIKWKSVEMVIWLDYPFVTTLFRAVKRAIRRSITKEELWAGTGNTESFRKSFFSKESIILWTIKTHGQVRKKYDGYIKDSRLSHIKFVRLKSDEEVERFLTNLNYNWQPLSVDELNSTLTGLECDWAIAGGWAIDLFLGRETRKHEDIDVIIRRDDQLKLQTHLKDWDLWVADPPGTLRPWKKSEFIGKGLQDIWCRRSPNDSWKIQIMLFDVENGDWIFKRDESIRKNLRHVISKSKNGLNILSPEVQLLYKSKSLREKDRVDFDNALQAMSSEQKSWLKETILKVYKNDHEWLIKL